MGKEYVSINKKVEIDLKTDIPDHEIESLARCFLPDIIEYFNSDEGKKEFEIWKQEKETKEDDKKR